MEAPEPRCWQEEIRHLRELLLAAGLDRDRSLSKALRTVLFYFHGQPCTAPIRDVIYVLRAFGQFSIHPTNWNTAINDVDGVREITSELPTLAALLDTCLRGREGDDLEFHQRIHPLLAAADRAVREFNDLTAPSHQVESYARGLSDFIAAHVDVLDEKDNPHAETLESPTWPDILELALSIGMDTAVPRLRLERLLVEAQQLANATVYPCTRS